jgi:hypothetical protein
VGRLRGEDHGRLQTRPVLADGVHLVIEGMKGGMRQPGLIEVQVLDVFAKHLLDRLDVVEHAVIGGLCDGHHLRLDILALDEGVGLDLSADALDAEFLSRNRPDDAQMIAGGLQKDRYRAGHHDGMQHALVAVAINQHHIVGGHRGMPDDLVGR